MEENIDKGSRRVPKHLKGEKFVRSNELIKE